MCASECRHGSASAGSCVVAFVSPSAPEITFVRESLNQIPKT